MRNLILGLSVTWAIAASWMALSFKQSAQLYQQEIAQLKEVRQVAQSTALDRNIPAPSKAATEIKLEERVASSAVSNRATPQIESSSNKQAEAGSEAAKRLRSFLAETRVKVIGKFVPLNETQREQLKALYLEEKERRANFNSAEMKARLNEIIGAENAEFFNTQREAAFKRRESEEQLKQALLISRQLALSSEQEAKLLESMKFVASEVENFEATDPAGEGVKFEAAPEDKMRFYIERSQFEAELLRSEVEKFLEPEQYKKYIELEAQSEASDMTLWH